MLSVCAVIPLLLSAQQPITFQCFYDDTNQLVRVVDSTGINLQYLYDPVGNILRIERTTVTAGSLTLFNVTPGTTATGGTITIQGQNFDLDSTNDLVTINGISAKVLSATATTLVVELPATATSGTIAVTVNGVTMNYSVPEVVLPVPMISSITPRGALPGTTVSNLQLTGHNLTGATFSFQLGIAVTSALVDPSGTSATLSVTVSATAPNGRYALLATTDVGASSPAALWAVNSLSVAGPPGADADNDGLSNQDEVSRSTDLLSADTDGDTYSDGVEVALGSDPLDLQSLPSTSSGVTATILFSILNLVDPGTGAPVPVQTTSLYSLLNSVDPGTGAPVPVQTTTLFSLLNSIDPGTGAPVPVQTTTLFSLLNSVDPGSGVYVPSQSTVFFSVSNELSAPPLSTSTQVSGRSFPSTYQAEQKPPNTYMLKVSAQQLRAMRFRRFQLQTLGGLDSDGDGLPDTFELILGSDPHSSDSDRDGLSDGVEYVLTGDPFSAKPDLDDDGDGLPNSEEGSLGTDPANPDTDGDGLSDGDEVRVFRTNPLMADTDGDRFADGVEILFGTDPLDFESKPSRFQQMVPAVSIGAHISILNEAIGAHLKE